MPELNDETFWWRAPKNQAYSRILRVVRSIADRQSKLYDKFVRLDAMYDPNSVRAEARGRTGTDSLGLVTENVIASNVDTVTAAVAATDVRARFMTDDADWTVQRTARQLEWYVDGICKLQDVGAKCRAAFKGGALKGGGLVHVLATDDEEIHTEYAPIDEFAVDEAEAHSSSPRNLHRSTTRDRDELRAMYPSATATIDRAGPGRRSLWELWASNRPYATNEIQVVYSWRLPVGKKGKRGYTPGREVVSVDGGTLIDRAYHKTYFPLGRFVWSEPDQGWFGIGGAERIAGHQRALNRRNWQIDRLLQQNAVPTTYVRRSDISLAMRTTNELGTIAVYNGDKPETVHPPVVNKETYASRDQLKASAFEEFGVSRLAAQSQKPAGLESGVALREYRDQTTQRFAMQEKGFEQLWLDVAFLIVDRCKELGAAAPVISRRTRYGKQKIRWADVDLGDAKIQIAAASTLPRTPAGRMQTVLEWAQAGVVSMDEARRLMQHPDLDRALSVYTAALEAIEHSLEEILDGRVVMPEPFDNLKMAVWRGQMEYLNARDNGAPEEILEALRQYVVQAAAIIGMQKPAANDMGAAAGAMPGGPGGAPAAMGPGAVPALPGGPPTNDIAVSALAPPVAA